MAEKEYIEREAAITTYKTFGHLNLRNALEAFEEIPAADVRPVVRGRWIDHQEGRWVYAKCSECGTVHDVKSNFCPNCGARMGER